MSAKDLEQYCKKHAGQDVLTLESETNPTTTLDEMRLGRIQKTDIRMYATSHKVDQSYLRWRNIALDRYGANRTWATIFGVALNRERKLIHIVDPTNAHFYEDAGKIPPSKGIWMDVVEEYKAKMKYIFVCPCPSRKECACYQGWEVDFFRCKEISPGFDLRLNYPQRTLEFIFERRFGTMITCYYVEKAMRQDVDFFLRQMEDGTKNSPDYWNDPEEFYEWNEGMKERMYETIMRKRKMDEEEAKGDAKGVPESSDGSPGKDEKTGTGKDGSAIANCDLCGKTKSASELKRCSRCKKTYYCDKECQQEDWKVHKRVCVPPPKSITLPDGNKALFLSPMSWDRQQLSFIPAQKEPKLQSKKKKET